MSYHLFDSEVIQITSETPDTKRFVFQVSELEQYHFIPGQYTLLDLPINGKQTTRAYSIASPPDTNTLELIITHKANGAGTDYLFNEVKAGTKIKLSSPLGQFTLSTPPPDTELCFICTGTGIAPFRSMLLNIFNRKLPHKNITLIFGTRYESDLLYRDEMEELQNKISKFQYIPVLSRETGEQWKGEKGYVHTVYKKLYAEKRPVLFFLCGWKEMVAEAVKNLEALGYEKEQLRYELYN